MEDYEIREIVRRIRQNKSVSRDEVNKFFLTFHEKREQNVPLEDIDERTILILLNEKLINFVLNRYFPAFCNSEDLFSVGKIGLVRAVDNFDESKKCEFSTYAIPWIMNAINSDLNKKKAKSNIPESLIVYLSDTVFESKRDDKDIIEEDMLADDYDFVEEVLNCVQCEDIYRLFIYLNPVEQATIVYTYGLFNVQILKVAEIAKMLGKGRTNCIHFLKQGMQKLVVLNKNREDLNEEEQRFYAFATKTQYPLIKEIQTGTGSNPIKSFV